MAGESLLRNNQSRVERIHWMLTRKLAKEAGQLDGMERRVPSYGDLTALNTSRLILDSVGSSLLSDLFGDLMDLLDTSCAVYEKDGDYALGIFSSSWCQFMDQASRRRCDTLSNLEAIKSGKWHCHESCWNEAARRAIETKEPVDVACRGGIRLFAVPICAGKEIVGGISVGYGDPPCDPARLSELATAYGVPMEDLRRRAEAYDTRPPFIIDWAKKQLLHLARFIGEIVERKQAEQALRRSEEKFRALFNYAKDAIFIHDLEGRLLDANQEACERLGYSHDELLKMGPLEIDTSEQAIYLERMETLHRQGHLLFETVNRNRDGTQVPVEVSLQLFELAGKQVCLAFCRDITERKRAKEALEKRIVALTQPLDAVESIAFEDLFNLSDLQRLQDLFADAWGVAALITRPDGTPITQPSNFTYFCSEFIRKTEKGFRNCQISDGMIGRHDPSGPIIQMCLSAGLWGAGASITVGGRHVGNWLIGQVRNEAQTEEQIMAYARELGADETAFREAFLKVPVMPQEKFEQIAHALFALASQLSTSAYQNIQQARFIAERKQAEEALRESERKLSEAQKIAQLGHWAWDVGTGEVEWSEEVFKIFQLDPHSFTPQIDSILALSPWPEDHERDKDLIRKAIASREKGTYEQRFLRPDKSSGYYVSSFQGKYDDNGHLAFMVGTVQDITERKEAEEAIRQSEEKLKEAQHIARLGNWELDLIENTLQWSDGIYELFEINPMEFGASYEAFLDAIHPDDREMVGHVYSESLKNRTPYEISHRLLMKDGRIKWVNEICRTEYDKQTNPLKSFGIVQDITELKQVEEALRESEARFRLVVESSPLAIGVANQDARIEYLNPKFVEKFGYTIEDIPTLADWFRLAYPDPTYRERTVERWQMELERAANESGAVHGMEVEVTCKDGLVRPIEVFRTQMGSKTLSVFNDLTERNRMEEERRKLEAQMREVQKLESLGVLAGGIAHDFNNLLMAILGRADLALLSLSPVSPAYHHVEEITRSSQRAADLCRQMLAYSGKGSFVVGRYDLSEIVQEMGQLLEVSVSKNAVMRYSLTDGLPAVESDATQIRQVIMNLITNASEALGDRRGVITIVTGVMECDETYLSESYLDDSLPGGKYVTLEVSDTGCGMDAETRSRIFDPFFTTKFTGRGLGLAAVLGIVRGHKGAIKVYSEVGKGTTFKILLPAMEWEPGERVKTAEQAASLQGGGTILLIDDDPLVLDVASEMLAQLGFQVLTAINGREGLKVFRTHKDEITCVILDLTMPVMGGEEAFRELRNLRSDLRVILSSGYNEQDVTQRFVGRGLAGFIQKPYTTAHLRSALNRALG